MWSLKTLDLSNPGVEFLFNWMYGWAVTAGVATLLMPIDTIRYRVTLCNQIYFVLSSMISCHSFQRRIIVVDRKEVVPKYKGVRHCAVRIVKDQGMLRLWRGTTANIIMLSTRGLMLAGFSVLERLTFSQVEFCEK